MQITDKILSTPGSSWSELFEKVDFFSQYKTYVQVIASASTSDGIKGWCVLHLKYLSGTDD
jgi:poly(A) polymerase